MLMPKRITFVAICIALACLTPAPQAAAAEISLGFTRPTNTSATEVDLEFEINGSLERVTATIPPNTSAGTKRNLIKQALEGSNFDVADVGLTGLRIEGLRGGTKLSFKPGRTGEEKDTQTATGINTATFGFANALFSPFDALGQPALFTGGVITDAGELSTQISALNLPDTSGQSIAQALFAQLELQAPNFGASLAIEENTLTATFDPNFAQGEVGVVFGTTSLSAGVFGSLTAVPEPAAGAAALLAGPVLLLRRRLLRPSRREARR